MLVLSVMIFQFGHTKLKLVRIRIFQTKKWFKYWSYYLLILLHFRDRVIAGVVGFFCFFLLFSMISSMLSGSPSGSSTLPSLHTSSSTRYPFFIRENFRILIMSPLVKFLETKAKRPGEKEHLSVNYSLSFIGPRYLSFSNSGSSN